MSGTTQFREGAYREFNVYNSFSKYTSYRKAIYDEKGDLVHYRCLCVTRRNINF